MRLAIKMLAKNSDLDSEPSGIRTLDTLQAEHAALCPLIALSIVLSKPYASFRIYPCHPMVRSANQFVCKNVCNFQGEQSDTGCN